MPCGDANCRLRESELLTSGPPQIARPYEFPSSVVPLFAVLGTSTNLFSLLTSNKSTAFAAFLADEIDLVTRKVSDEKLPDIRRIVKAINTLVVRSPEKATVVHDLVVNSPESANSAHDLVVSNPKDAKAVDLPQVNSATAAKCDTYRLFSCKGLAAKCTTWCIFNRRAWPHDTLHSPMQSLSIFRMSIVLISELKVGRPNLNMIRIPDNRGLCEFRYE